MHNKVVYRVARALRNSGHVVLRFNFRGVGKSEGRHADGIGEIEDARAGLDWLRNRYPGLPYTLAGFSFGSRVALSLACGLGDAERVIALGFPAAREVASGLANCNVPKIFVQSTHDEHGPRPAMEAFYEQVTEPKRLIWVEAEELRFGGGEQIGLAHPNVLQVCRPQIDRCPLHQWPLVCLSSGPHRLPCSAPKPYCSFPPRLRS